MLLLTSPSQYLSCKHCYKGQNSHDANTYNQYVTTETLAFTCHGRDTWKALAIIAIQY